MEKSVIRINCRINLDDEDLYEFKLRYEKLPIDRHGRKIGVTKLVERALMGHYGRQSFNHVESESASGQVIEEEQQLSDSVKRLANMSF